MVQFAFLLPSIYFLVAFAKGEQIKSSLIDIPIQHSSTQLNAFTNKNDFNGTKSIENQPKSRRKRYVAFPEGSSFSVIFFKHDTQFLFTIYSFHAIHF